ncbi:hypothetical protein BD289DRAFT_98737 [Coniella lustricola]|uniref:Uncharacterized protein n=1 Tax=Coniella lustricola TaxID=2025994 RepID=A0A2T3AN17_9PEZI|nr:hypothetical protein BD289DRAFT_98737 [Coniella lustricola]
MSSGLPRATVSLMFPSLASLCRRLPSCVYENRPEDCCATKPRHCHRCMCNHFSLGTFLSFCTQPRLVRGLPSPKPAAGTKRFFFSKLYCTPWLAGTTFWTSTRDRRQRALSAQELCCPQTKRCAPF